jgi:hypothetical protein
MTKECRPLSGAPVTMRKQGQITDSVFLDEVIKKPGMTASEIAKTLNWSNGKIDGSINRLVSQKKISVKHYLQRGVLVKKIYPFNYEITKNVVELKSSNINKTAWKDSGVIYALSRSTIGLAPKEIDEWNEKALFKEKVNFQKSKEKIDITIPKNLERFYQLENSDVSISTFANSALVTVESILPVNLPASYPEQRPIAQFELVVNRERIEGVSSNSSFVYLREGIKKQLTVFSGPIYGSFKTESVMAFVTSTANPCNQVIDIIAKVQK